MMRTGALARGYCLRTKDFVEEWRRQGKGEVPYRELCPGKERDTGFVAVIPHGRVWGAHGCILTPDQKMLWDVSREWDASPRNHSVFQVKSAPQVKHSSESVAVLSKIGSSNYYHWMFDVLPRIQLLRLSQFTVDKYIVPQPLAPFQRKTLEMFGIDAAALIPAGPEFYFESAQLVVPSLPLEARWAADFLRSELLPRIPAASEELVERLYISRENCLGRTVLNEQEVLAALQPLGFRKIVPESLSVEDQVRLFSRAEVIVGPQGAAFANALFCQPRARVVELMAPTFFITSTEKICSYVNVAYHRIMATSQRHPKYLNSDWYWSGLDNILVDVGELMRIVTSTL